MPPTLVEAQARANSACEKVWREARRTSDFALVRAASCARWSAGARTGRGAGAGARAVAVRRADGRLPARHRCRRCRAGVRPTTRRSCATLCRGPRNARRGKPARRLRPQGPFPIAAQEALCRRLAEAAGLDLDHARLDRSAHPFCGGTPTDVRITTRYDEADFAQAVLARGARDRPRAVRTRPAGGLRTPAGR